MTKLRTLLVTALLTLPVLTLSSAQAATNGGGSGTRLETQSTTGCCVVYFMGRWICVPVLKRERFRGER